MEVLAIIPARAGSKGIPKKNWKRLGDVSPVQRAIWCAESARISQIVVTADDCPELPTSWQWLERPPELAQDDTPMFAVVRHVLEQIPGPPDQKIVLLQPTQPLRQPKHITQALELLTPEWDSVVSVAETHPIAKLLSLCGERLYAYEDTWDGWAPGCDVRGAVERRQDAEPNYYRDGTAYVCWRKTVEEFGDIYGANVRALIIPPEETCPLDTPADWAEAERRLALSRL